MNNRYITNGTPIFTGAMSAFPYSDDLMNRYKFTTAFDEEVCGAVIDGDLILVPRETAPISQNDNRVKDIFPHPITSYSFKPRHEQEILCNKSIELLKSNQNHIFEAPTGWGKTVAGAAIACSLGQPTIIVVTKEDLLEQWKNSLINILGIHPDLIGRVQQDICDWQGKMFVLGMTQSLIIPNRYPKEMYNYFGLLILDEVHLMAADCFVRTCQMFPAYYRLGFSATPQRRDGKTKLLNWHIGPTLVIGSVNPMKPKVFVKQTNWRMPPIPYQLGRMMHITKIQSRSSIRNNEIVKFVKKAYEAGRNILILSDLIKHLELLEQLFIQNGISREDISYYIGGMDKNSLDIAKNKRIVLGSYKMCSTGTDVPRWNCLVFATPRVDIRQAVGRVLRVLEGKKQPIILDLVDADDIFQGFYMARVKQYNNIDAEIVSI